MKTKNLYEEADELGIQIETFLKGVRSSKSREAIAIVLCQTVASCATYKNSNIFASLSILETAKKELQATICDVVDEHIGDELMEYVKEHPEKIK